MRFDKELMFVDEEALQDAGTGVLGDPVDLGAAGQGKGRQSFVAICCDDDTTATGDPEISFALETADAEDFLQAKTIPLALPPLKKEDLGAGKCVYSPVPLYLERHVRLTMTTSSAITCAGFSAGIVLDPQMGV